MKAPRRGRNGRRGRHAPPGSRPSSRIYTPAPPRRTSHTPDAQASCSCACILAFPLVPMKARPARAESRQRRICLVRTVKGRARAVFKAPTGCAAHERERRAEGVREDRDHAGVAGSAGICCMREVQWMSPCASISGGADKKAVAARRERLGQVTLAWR
jgi:hypothetical protein